MAGHVLRYDGTWFYRGSSNKWFRVDVDLPTGIDTIPTRHLTPVVSQTELILETLFQHNQRGELPPRILKKAPLVIPLPVSALDKENVERVRPNKNAKKGR